ncbi:hypothetical protein CBS101457_002025 [Exobasidium rhododendri]|nr:hypothetical protein CBS101457_002025 [Exobasidium rhododendri]
MTQSESRLNKPALDQVLILGLRKAGKSSSFQVVFESLNPEDALQEGVTQAHKSEPYTVNAFHCMKIWDGTSNFTSMPSNTATKAGGDKAEDSNAKGKAAFGTGDQLYWTECSAIIFVVDSQGEYFEALERLNDVILSAYSYNPLIHFHVFVHKADGHSNDYRYEVGHSSYFRSSSAMLSNFTSAGLPSGIGSDLERDVRLSFHVTSILNCSINIAWSRVQIDLMNVEVSRTLESICNGLCSSSKLEKVFLFDVPSKTYVTADGSPFDEATFDMISDYLTFLVQFSGLYSSSGVKYDKDGHGADRYASSVMRLAPDTTLAFHQVNDHLGLVYVVRNDLQARNAGMIDYNISIARRAIMEVYEACSSA